MRSKFTLPIIVIAGLLTLFFTFKNRFERKEITAPAKPVISAAAISSEWVAPSLDTVALDSRGALIRYGRDLIANTSKFLGPKGKIAKKSNGLNCQNCHIEAGMRPFGNSFSAVSSTYPKFRDRSGKIESVEFRVNECMERSLNGKKLDSLSKEMQAMVAYMKWIGQHVPKGVKPKGAGTEELKFLDRAADVNLGKGVYIKKCQVCHGKNGEGIFNADSSGYVYPPLWGPNSYNVSAGLYRLTRFAGYVKYTMPFGSTHKNPQLTDEEAWDVAAFVNSQPHPKKLFKYDWPDIRSKPVDYPFGP
ncbi:MAG TPA: c-type cytochrome, partial [Chitinophagaceae bacterium]|nr:c-type cytochrome [Chitinophagaceae bacterium]